MTLPYAEVSVPHGTLREAPWLLGKDGATSLVTHGYPIIQQAREAAVRCPGTSRSAGPVDKTRQSLPICRSIALSARSFRSLYRSVR